MAAEGIPNVKIVRACVINEAGERIEIKYAGIPPNIEFVHKGSSWYCSLKSSASFAMPFTDAISL